MRFIKEERPSKFIESGERRLRHAIDACISHSHLNRKLQGPGNRLIDGTTDSVRLTPTLLSLHDLDGPRMASAINDASTSTTAGIRVRLRSGTYGAMTMCDEALVHSTTG